MGDMLYGELIRDMIWSYSRLECFEACPYRWFLKYIEHETEEPQFYASYGSFMHELLAEFYSGRAGREACAKRFLLDFSDKVRGERPPGRIPSDFIDAGYNFLKTAEPLPFRTLGVERNVQFGVADAVFTGFIDYIGERDGKLYVIDHKSADIRPRSGKAKPTAKDKELDERLRQLYLYSAAVFAEFGRYPATLCFNCYRTGAFVEEPFDEERYFDTLDRAAELIRTIRDCDDFPAHPDFFRCRYLCGLQNECCYFEGR